MTGRFSSPEHSNVFQGRNQRTGGVQGNGGIPLSTASFKLNVHGNSSSMIKSNDVGVEDEDGVNDTRGEQSVEIPASFLDSNRKAVDPAGTQQMQ